MIDYTKKAKNLSSNEKKTIAGVLGCCCLATAGIVIGTYLTFGSIGWKVIRNHVAYEDKYYKSLAVADLNKDENVDPSECENWFQKMGVTQHMDETYMDVRPAYKSLKQFEKNNR
ncbi:MAG: hypothetical protein ABIC91_08325 [Nanoarchaeota archaeon]|nr:hypothetical protein [Nanoarchaeota archaeon]MBU1030960.1 hypothetical protein [Nanoarchaeota archaeon]MBU1849885.1 hypothetical protein [Nanoarchaeota archaeon]